MKKNPISIENFVLLYDNVLVKPIEIKERAGVIRATSYEKKPELGEVLAIGQGRIFDNGVIQPLVVKKGDIVYFNEFSTVKVNFDGVDYFIIREEDIVGYSRGS